MAWLLKTKKEQIPEIQRSVEDLLAQKPFNVIAIYVLLADNQEALMSKSDVKAMIEKSIFHVTAADYALIRYGDYNTLFIERLKAYEGAGDVEATTAKKIREHLDKLEKEFESHPYFQSSSKYEHFKEQLDEVCTYTDLEKFRSLVELVDLRRLNFKNGLNYSLQTQQLKQKKNLLWSRILFAIFQGQNDEGISELIRELPSQGIHLRYALK